MKVIRKLSILVPVFNEENTIVNILKKVDAVDLGIIAKEILVVNDGSMDSTLKLIKGIRENGIDLRIINHRKNRGKGCAIRTGIKYVTGDVIVIQDGDNEYDPRDYKKMLAKMLEPNVRVVYGSRNLGKKFNRYSGLNYYVGGLILTHLTNTLFGSRITDEPTCYKMFETKLLRSLGLKSKRFEFCPEVTAKVLKRGEKIHEVPIIYNPRKIKEGKKIRAKDFFEAANVLIKEKLTS